MKNLISKAFLPFMATLVISLCSFCEKENPAGNGDPQYIIRPDKAPIMKVSNKLLGFNIIYPHEKNAIWQDGKIASYLKDANVAFLRYPGGTVCSYYHWNALTGEGWKDSWDPKNKVVSKDPSEFMDINEYMDLVKATGATPLVGINMSSGWRWNRLDDGVKEAISLMQYCKDKNFKVEYWYLDNEPYQHDSNGGSKTPEQYAALINAYVPAMKAFDPNIKIVVNWNAGFKNKRSEYERLIKNAGSNIDVIDAHWYWSWSNASWERWLEKTPMAQWTGSTYADDIAYFRQMVKEMGYPNIQLASFEWNCGPIKPNSLTVNQVAFTQAEMMMQFISGGLDYAVFWPLQWPDQTSKIRSLVNTSGNTANPNLHFFKFFGKMQGGWLAPVEILSGVDKLVTVSVQDPESKVLRLCILNKNSDEVVSGIDLEKFPGIKLKEAKMYTVNADGSQYTLEEVKTIKSGKKDVTFTAKPVSLTMLTFEQR